MEIYSPGVKKTDTFRKNTMKEKVMVNSKGSFPGTTVVFELKKERKRKNEPKLKKQRVFVSMLDFLKIRFYERMKVFFDYEDRYNKERVSTTLELSEEI